MKSDIELAINILHSRIDSLLLTNLYDAVFAPTKTKFFAFAYSIINKELYEGLEYSLNKIGHSSAYNADQERKKNYIDKNTWTIKDAHQCIEEGIYTSYGIRFTGMLYEDEWYIKKELLYFGEKVNEEHAKRILIFNNKVDETWNALGFVPYTPRKLPNGEMGRDVDLEEFAHEPFIVANIKQERKLSINRAFVHYINLEIFIPFAENIKIKFPEEFVACIPLYSEDYTLIFPKHKQFVIAVMMVVNSKNEYTIRYFLYTAESKKIYEWMYFNPQVYNHGFHYSLEVIEYLSKISEWNDHHFFVGSRTLDDENFWNEYVFKKKDDAYLYLIEIDIVY